MERLTANPHPLDAAARDELDLDAQLRVRVTRTVSSDLPAFIENVVTVQPGEYPATISQYGAVCVSLPNGGKLGVKPHEFEFIAENVAALVAAARRGVEDTARIDALAANPDKLVCVRSYSTESRLNEWFVLGAHRKGQTTDIREALDNLAAFYPAARTHPEDTNAR